MSMRSRIIRRSQSVINFKTQHDDLIEAEKTLIGIIEELDTGMRKQFMEKFAEIQKQFDTVFKELFGGGKVHWNWWRMRIS